MEALYTTGAQLVPVLLIVMAVDLGREAVDFAALKRFLLLAGVAEAACLIGIVGVAIPRLVWIPAVIC